MAITIKVSDADGDGTGINFSKYLAQFEKNFEKTGYGAFSNPTDDTGFSAEDYVSYDEADGQSVIFGSGADDWTYDLATHVISGDLSTITFGFGTSYDEEADIYSNDADIVISGLGITGTSTSSGTIINDLMNSETDSLVAYLKSDAIVFKGSSGADVFSGYGHDDRITGGGGNDTLAGGAGDDTLNGGKGRDMLSGNKGDDTFVFSGKTGYDTISDFQEGKSGGDVISFDDKIFDSFRDVIDAAKDTRKGVLIEYDGGKLLLTDVEISGLHKGDFDFF
jgi:Ca2+-binding RTX toxin-like protein